VVPDRGRVVPPRPRERVAHVEVPGLERLVGEEAERDDEEDREEEDPRREQRVGRERPSEGGTPNDPRVRGHPSLVLARDEVLPGGQVLLVVERLRIEDLHLRQSLLRWEDERVVRDRRVVLLRPYTGAGDRWDVVDAYDVVLGIAGLHEALNLRVV